MSSMTLVTMEATTEQLDRFGAASEAWDGYANTLSRLVRSSYRTTAR